MGSGIPLNDFDLFLLLLISELARLASNESSSYNVTNIQTLGLSPEEQCLGSVADSTCFEGLCPEAALYSECSEDVSKPNPSLTPELGSCAPLWQEYSAALRSPSVSPWLCSTLFITQPCNPVGEFYLPTGGDWAAYPTAGHAGGCVPQRWRFACKEHSALISMEPFKCFQMLPCFEKYSDTWCYFPDLNATCWYRIRKKLLSASFNKSGRSNSQCLHLMGDVKGLFKSWLL